MVLAAILPLPTLGLWAQQQTPHAQDTAQFQETAPVTLPNGWRLTPAGRQVPLSSLPMSIALAPDEKYAVVLNGGFLPPTLSVIDPTAGRETARVPVKDAWHGLTFNAAGDKLFVGGGSEAAVFEFNFQEGKLTAGRAFPVRPASERRPSDHVGDAAFSPDGRFLYVANLFRNRITVMNASTGFVVKEFATGFRPYRLLMSPSGKTLFVSHWAESSIGLYSLDDGRLLEKIPVGPHPTDMLIRPETDEGDASAEPQASGDPLLDEALITARLFVACANTNSVWSLGLTANDRVRPLERIVVSPTPHAPAGSTPTALALGPEGRYLYVVTSDNNAVVVVDVSAGRAQVAGAIPTGWYPTDVAVTPDGTLLYLSGKGGGSRAAPRGLDPTRRNAEADYVAARQTGSLGIMPVPDEAGFEKFTRQVIENSLFDESVLSDAGVPEGNPIPNRPRLSSPIRHVIYVIKENRTYDQVLGDVEGGRGDPALTVFGESVTPNHHKLSREFVLFDNFHTDGDVSADGLSWSVSAMATDFIQKLWPSYYGRRRKVFDFEGGDPTAIPPARYLWSNALGAGLTVRNYGVWTASTKRGPVVKDPGLTAHTAQDFPPFDLDITDAARVDVFLRELSRFEAAGDLARLILVRLPGDHTAGRAPGKPTARAMMAEHDYALGKLIEGVSRSRFWPQTAVFVVEDDAQDGADHVDSHRSVLLVASPYAKRGFVDSERYSTTSVLRTIELILGLRPMTQFDAAAVPLWRAFQSEADSQPYEAVKPKISIDEKNRPGKGGKARRVERRPPAGPSTASTEDGFRPRAVAVNRPAVPSGRHRRRPRFGEESNDQRSLISLSPDRQAKQVNVGDGPVAQNERGVEKTLVQQRSLVLPKLMTGTLAEEFQVCNHLGRPGLK